VAALIVVLSVMNGFQKELRTRILGVASHIQITGISGELANWPLLAEQAAKHPEVRCQRRLSSSRRGCSASMAASRGR
jgi:lipoprotein-releasing system permease protein